MSAGSKWGPICYCLMMKFLVRTQSAPLHPIFILWSLIAIWSLYHPQELAMAETVSHPLLRLCEREVKPGIHNFKWKAPGWLSQGTISSEPFVPAGQRVGSWSRGCESMEGTRKEWFYQGYPYYCISSSQCKAFRKHWVIKVKCQSHSRILSHLIEALSVAVSVYFLISWHLFSI